MSERIKKALMGLAALAALALGGGAIAQAGSSGGGDKAEHGEHGEYGEQDESVSGPQANRAKEAALEATKGGEVNAVERDGENGATWEVEVTKTDGQTVDVRLDQAYQPIVVEGDSEDGDE